MSETHLEKLHSFTREDCDQLHCQVLDKHTGLQALTNMINHLECALEKQPSHKSDIIGVESFLSSLSTSVYDQSTKKSNKPKTKSTKSPNIQKQIKKIGESLLKDAKTWIVFSIFFIILFATNFDPKSNTQESTHSGVELTSKYLIQNLRGDTMHTHLSWRLVEGDVLHVNILNADKFPEAAEVIKNALLSESTLEIDNSLLHKGPKGTTSTYYMGWKGALEASSQNETKLYIPTNFEIIQSNSGEGDIIIELSSMTSGDGHSGFARTLPDSTNSQILKSYITLYDVDVLSKNQLETIFLHEFGHAMGLAHSTAPEDLMHSTITTAYPYISQCNIDAIVSLYNEEEFDYVTCEL